MKQEELIKFLEKRIDAMTILQSIISKQIADETQQLRNLRFQLIDKRDLETE